MKKTVVLFLTFGIWVGVSAQKKVKLEDNTNASNFYFHNGKVGIGKLPNTAELSLGKKTGADGSLIRLSLEPPKHTGGPWNYIARDAGSYAYLDQYYGRNHLLTFRHDGKIGIGKQPNNAELSVGKKTGTDGSLIRLSLEPPKHTGGPWNYIARDAGSYAYLDQYYGNNHLLTFRHDGKVGIGKQPNNSELSVGKKTGADGSLTRLSLEPPKHTGGPWNFITRDAGSYAYLDQYYGSIHLVTYRHDGKVGIGTKNTGSHRLAVEGSIGAREIKVQASGWADFVFEKEYTLPTLEQVESHIKKNGHLKGIPSAKDVSEHGILLGDMNAKLLQKIEELTLYTIAQEKRIDKLESNNQNLQNENEKLKSISQRLTDIEKLLKTNK